MIDVAVDLEPVAWAFSEAGSSPPFLFERRATGRAVVDGIEGEFLCKETVDLTDVMMPPAGGDLAVAALGRALGSDG